MLLMPNLDSSGQEMFPPSPFVQFEGAHVKLPSLDKKASQTSGQLSCFFINFSHTVYQKCKSKLSNGCFLKGTLTDINQP